MRRSSKQLAQAAAASRRWYAKNRERRCEQVLNYQKCNPEKARAKSTVNYHKKQGDICPLPCEICGRSDNVVAHHENYNRQLAVRWLCRRHHQMVHDERVVLPSQDKEMSHAE